MITTRTYITGTYSQEGRIYLDNMEIGTYDADGADTWHTGVADVLADHGYMLIDWLTDDTFTAQNLHL